MLQWRRASCCEARLGSQPSGGVRNPEPWRGSPPRLLTLLGRRSWWCKPSEPHAPLLCCWRPQGLAPASPFSSSLGVQTVTKETIGHMVPFRGLLGGSPSGGTHCHGCSLSARGRGSGGLRRDLPAILPKQTLPCHQLPLFS